MEELNLNKERYHFNNFTIIYDEKDKGCIDDLEKAILDGYKTILKFMNLSDYQDTIILDIYNSIEKFHQEQFGKKREEWLVACNEKQTIKMVSPLNPGKIHHYDTMLLIANKCIQDLILEKKFPNIPKWLSITTYTSGLMTEVQTWSNPKITRFKDENYYNDSDAYFIMQYIIKEYGKETIINILNNPEKYNEILGLSDIEIDKRLYQYYKRDK